ncbi:MAG: peptide-methionine (S)-S-oxide reductase MsrA [Desulfobacterales bacterium]
MKTPPMSRSLPAGPVIWRPCRRHDPIKVSYEQLLTVFWRQIDPTDGGGSFVDRGSQYRSAIFTHDDAQKQAAEQSKAALAASGRYDGPIATEIIPAGKFYPAEDYHQDYYKKIPSGTNFTATVRAGTSF